MHKFAVLISDNSSCRYGYLLIVHNIKQIFILTYLCLILLEVELEDWCYSNYGYLPLPIVCPQAALVD